MLSAPRHDATLQAVLDCVAQPVWVVDHDGAIRYANRAARAALAGEEWFERGDGSTIPPAAGAVPIDLPEGPGVVVTLSGPTQQALRERDAILAQVAQPVWVVDHDGRFRYANPAALAALGYEDLSELEGRPGHETVHYKYPDGTPFPAEDCLVTRARLTGQALQEHEDWLVRKDGSILWIAYSTAPFELPEGLGSVTAFTDIEERRRIEQATRERDVAEARAAELRLARRRIIEAADAARARLTRDLHDGAQQLFVSAVISLQLAEKQAARDAEQAARLRASALELARDGIKELRDLAAGIHPGILADRGLGAAVDALGSRLPLPVAILATPEQRLPPPVEASVYFFVSEALTNVVKHAHAQEATVRIAAENGHLVVEIADDGIGGAHATPHGTGLAGLADRVAALDGALTVTSPTSGGTTLRAEIPL